MTQVEPIGCHYSPAAERREFLRLSSAFLVGLAASPWIHSEVSAAQGTHSLPTVPFGPHLISRLVVGSNPICGFSHLNGLMSRIMSDYFTPERVVQFLKHCTSQGINTFQSSYSEKIDESLRRFRQSGSKINWICLANHELLTEQKALDDLIAAHRPIGVAHHGGVTDRRYRERKMDIVREFLKRVRDTGVQVGLSTHNPEVIEYVEERDWDIDFYMTCFYRVTRTPEELKAHLGEIPLGEVYLSGDPERMCKVVRQTKRTCLGFKILAAGRRCDSENEVEKCFQFAFSNLKPTDGVIVGMFPLYEDHAKLNAGLTRKHGVVRT